MIFIFILNYVLIVTFWIFIYHEIWILLNIFLYGTIELFILWHVEVSKMVFKMCEGIFVLDFLLRN